MGSVWMRVVTIVLCFYHCHSQLSTVPVHIQINTSSPVHTVNHKFLSIALDFGIVRRGFHLYDFESPRLLTLTRALAPAFMRLGGTAEDFMTFEPNGVFHDDVTSFAEKYLLNNLERNEYGRKVQTPFNMTGDQLKAILKFKLDTQLDLFIGLNVFKRENRKWDSTNAITLMDFIAEKNVKVHWQLGNEPPWKKFNVSIEPEQLAADFLKLLQLKSKYPLFRDSMLVGPDIGQMKNKRSKIIFFDDYISHAVPYINAMTWHQYYRNGRIAKLRDFINPDLFDDLIDEINMITHLTRNYSPTLPIWLGETSSTYGGGTEGLSDRYVAGFMWLDKLGVSARHGLQAVIRQTLFSGNYALLDDDFRPRPDYWLSLIYKNLVGAKVLDVKKVTESKNVRVYAHCVNSASNRYPENSIVIFAMNLDQNDQVELLLGNSESQPISRAVDEFVLSPEDDDVKSESVLLNGRKLAMPDDRTLPDLDAARSDKIVLGPLTFGFFVLSNVQAEACM